MTFTSFNFFCFVALTVILYYLIPKKWRWIILLCASYAFYAVACIKYIFYIILTTVSTFAGGLLLEKYINTSSDYIKSQKSKWSVDEKKQYKNKVTQNKKLICAAVLVLNFGILSFLKYYNFFASSISSLLSALGLNAKMPELGLILPLGISFYTFQAMGYIIDIYRKKHGAERNIAKFALFVSFFPQIVQGPIDIYGKLAPQLYNGNKLQFENIKQGILLMLWGLFKKLIIADRLVSAITIVTDDYKAFSGTYILFVTLVYAVQLYADFSGGIDIARGVGQLLGINMAENFRRPYFSRSITEYWHRWHITLGAWLREYLFYPIAMSKAFQKFGKKIKKHFGVQLGKVLPTSIASLITFLVIGIWHGANWKYVGFGFWNGLIIMISTLLEPQFRTWKKKLHIQDKNALFIAFQMIRTFIIVLIGYYFDIAEGFVAAIRMMYASVTDVHLTEIMNRQAAATLGLSVRDLIIAGVACIVVLTASIIQEKTGKNIRECICRHGYVLECVAFLAVLFSIVIFGVYGPENNPSDFVYMQF